MKKKILLIAGLCLGLTGFAMAEGIVSNVGAGYYASFLGIPISHVDVWNSSIFVDNVVVFKNMPLGLSLLGGSGYGFGSEEKFILGGEAVGGWAVSLNPLGAFHFFLQGRAFGRYVPFEDFSVVGFAGVKGNLTVPGWAVPSGAYPVFGVRVEPLSFYVEYTIVLKENFSSVYSHDIAIGFMFYSG